MSNFKTKILRSVRNGLQSVDSLGYPITLTYKKSQTYQSVIGGIFTLIGKILILIYFGFQIQYVVNRSQTTISYYNFKRDLSKDQTPIIINRDNFDFSLYLYYDTIWNANGNKSENIQAEIDQYLNVRMYRTIIILPSFTDIGNYGYQIKNEQLKLEKCGKSGLKKMKSQISAIMQDYYCPQDNYTVPLYGTQTSQETSSMKIEVTMCDQEYLDQLHPNKGLKCKSEQEILRVLNYINLRFALATDYFDSKEYLENPIKPTSRMQLNSFQKDLIQWVNYKVAENNVILKDTMLYSALETRNLTYNEFKLDYNQVIDKSANKQFLIMKFSADENVQTTERKAFTIMDALSNTGGIMGTVFALLQFFLHFIEMNIFMRSIMKRLYYYQDDEQGKAGQFDSQVKIQPFSEMQIGDSERQIHGNDNSNSEKESWDDKQLYLNSTAKSFIKKQNQKIDRDLFAYIKSLKKYRFHMMDFIKYKVKKLLRIFCKRIRINTTESLYQVGRHHIEKELDIIRVFRAIRKVELLEQLLLTSSQLKLQPYLQQGVLRKQNELDKQSKPMKTMNDQCLNKQVQALCIDENLQSLKFIKQFGLDLDTLNGSKYFDGKVDDADNIENIEFEFKLQAIGKVNDNNN